MNCGKWVTASLCVALLAVSVSSVQAATTAVGGRVWISQWTGETQTVDDAVSDLKTAIADGVDGEYGAPVWQLEETAPGSGYYAGTFALYVNLSGDLSPWNNLLNAKSQVITFDTTNANATWSVEWNEYSSTNHSAGIWTNEDFLFNGVGESTNAERKTDFFAASADDHELTIGGKVDGQPLGIADNTGRANGTQWLLGVFDLVVSGVNSEKDIVFSISTTSNGYLQGTSDGMNYQNLMFVTPTLYEGENPFNGTNDQKLNTPTTYVFAATPPVPPVVPEPGTYAMLCGLGLIGAAWYRRNHKRA